MMAPPFWMPSTAVPPLKARRAKLTMYAVLRLTAAWLRPGRTCSPPAALEGALTTQMSPCGLSSASSIVPKLGAVAWSAAADREPSGCRVAVAISSPFGPLSEAVVVCCQTSVTFPPGVVSTVRPNAESAPSDEVEAMPPAHRDAPRGSVHR